MIYDFKCVTCSRIEEDVYLSIHHTDDDHPACCGEHMQDYITRAPYVAWQDRQLLDGGFKANHDGTLITSVKQNKEYMARHDLQLIDDNYVAPTIFSERKERAASKAAIDAITPTDDQMERMVEDGTMAQLEEQMGDTP